MQVLAAETAGTAPVAAPGVSFEEVHRAHAVFVFRALLRMGVPRADVPDATQQVFIVVHRRLHTFDGSSKVQTWLFGICLRVASDFRARAHVRRETVTAAPPDVHGPPTQERGIQMTEARAELDRLLDLLDTDKRAVFVLYELEEWTMPEIASAIGCPLQTAYSRHRAARKIIEAAARGESP